jgi:hypothetical protein
VLLVFGHWSSLGKGRTWKCHYTHTSTTIIQCHFYQLQLHTHWVTSHKEYFSNFCCDARGPHRTQILLGPSNKPLFNWIYSRGPLPSNRLELLWINHFGALSWCHLQSHARSWHGFQSSIHPSHLESPSWLQVPGVSWGCWSGELGYLLSATWSPEKLGIKPAVLSPYCMYLIYTVLLHKAKSQLL